MMAKIPNTCSDTHIMRRQLDLVLSQGMRKYRVTKTKRITLISRDQINDAIAHMMLLCSFFISIDFSFLFLGIFLVCTLLC